MAENGSVIVCGAGVIGLSTCYYLSRKGYNVICVDRFSGPGQVMSYKNGAFLDPAMYTSWADLAIVKENAISTMKGLWNKNASKHTGNFEIKALYDLSIFPWMVRFAYNLIGYRPQKNSDAVRCISYYGLEKLSLVAKLHPVTATNASALGTLQIFESATSYENARTSQRFEHVKRLGYSLHDINAAQAAALEPSLDPRYFDSGVLHSIEGRNGDIHTLCIALERACVHQGVKFLYNTDIHKLQKHGPQIKSIVTTQGKTLKADKYVISTGILSRNLLLNVNVKCPIIPIKGYIITAKTNAAMPPLTRNIFYAGYVLISPFKNHVQISGGADFAGLDYSENFKQYDRLLKQTEKLFPKSYIDTSSATGHTCIRCVTADDVPIIGQTKISNLYVNIGHGSKGYTQALGAGALLTNIICGDSCAIDPTPYMPDRF